MLHLQETESKEAADALGGARKRRLVPGADTTASEFAATFAALRDCADNSFADVQRMHLVHELSIPEQVRRLRNQILQQFPGLNEQVLRVAIGALSVYRLRLTDMHVREMVLLLWVVEGDSHMRCHNGKLYFFPFGCLCDPSRHSTTGHTGKMQKIFSASRRLLSLDGKCPADD